MGPDAAWAEGQAKAKAQLEEERRRQEDLLVQDAIRLLQKDQLELADIGQTLLLRKLLVAAWSDSATERQWATQQLMKLKGMSPSRTKKSVDEDPRVDLLKELRPT